MKKIIRKVGTSLGIIFDKEEQKIYKLKKDEIIEFEIKKTRWQEDGPKKK